jgi:hypothetical protein
MLLPHPEIHPPQHPLQIQTPHKVATAVLHQTAGQGSVVEVVAVQVEMEILA